MTKFTGFDRLQCQKFRYALTKAMEEMGLDVSIGNIRFNATSARCKIEVKVQSVLSHDGNEVSLEQAKIAATVQKRKQFESLCAIFGLKASHYGAIVKLSNGYTTKPFKITGILPNKKKNNIEVTRIEDGKVFIISPDRIIRQLAA